MKSHESHFWNILDITLLQVKKKKILKTYISVFGDTGNIEWRQWDKDSLYAGDWNRNYSSSCSLCCTSVSTFTGTAISPDALSHHLGEGVILV